MDAKKYTHLLANPENIHSSQIEDLKNIIDTYPYFQSARALQLKCLKNTSHFSYNDALKKTAAYTTDRNILFEYITSSHFVQNEISEIIQQHDASVNEITMEAEDVSEKISLELDQQIKKELKKAEAILNPNLFHKKQEALPETTIHISKAENTSETSILSENKKELSPNKPLEFNKEDSYSFSEWLQLTTATPIDRKTEIKEEKITAKKDVLEEKERKFDLIEKFIQKKPSFFPLEKTTTNPPNLNPNKNLASPYTQAPEALMTETLAKVYLQQKNYKKAIMAYKILILKYPEKSGYFADQIRAIKKLTNT